MPVIARFAPSPTGQVHIGNIRTAIFNWLFARHEKGKFLLRIEDTDLERSTKEAIDTLLECMKWLGLDYDGEIMYQTGQLPVHLAAAERLAKAGHAYRLDPGDPKSPLYFRLPYHCSDFPFVRDAGEAKIDLATDSVVEISRSGLVFRTVNPKGKIAENQYCLAGFLDLSVRNAAGQELFRLNEANLPQILDAVEPVRVEGAASLCFRRREVFYHDLVKGDLSKPLDSMRDFIVIRSDGSPVFHLANVCDDITQGVTHIVRGDDHVENTYRHLFLFQLLGAQIPVYAHLPMIVNAQGKPYSKRDGDAFVGDYREKGFLAEALFNYLSLLGWSPGDNREKMSRQEIVEAFHIEKAQRSPAQLDPVKLANMNGLYLADLSEPDFAGLVKNFADRRGWFQNADDSLFRRTSALMHSRTKVLTDVESWRYFFSSDFTPDPKAVRKNLSAPGIWDALSDVRSRMEKTETGSFTAGTVESLLRAIEQERGLKQFALNQPLRVVITGTAVGAGIYETAEVLGRDETCARILHAETSWQREA